MDRWKLTLQQRRQLERQLQATSDARVYKRTLALLEYNRGRSLPEIAASLSVTRQSVYNWISAYRRHQNPSALGIHRDPVAHTCGQKSDKRCCDPCCRPRRIGWDTSP